MSSERDSLYGYGIAFFSVSSAIIASSATWALSQSFAWLFFFSAVIVTSWCGGKRSGIAAIIALTLLGRYYFMRPFYSLRLDGDNVILVLLFLVVSLAIGLLAAARRRAKDMEEAERRRFRATVSSIAEGVIATDTEGRVTFLNGVAETLTGWTHAEAKGRRLDEVFVIVSEVTRLPAQNPVAKALKTGKVQGLENHTLLIARNGVERPIDDSAAPIMDDGRITGVVLVFRDVSERRRYEDELRDSDRRKDEFLAMLAHELRNPLSAVGNSVAVMKMARDQESLISAREVIARQTKHMTRLIDDLLDVSRISQGKIDLRKEVVETMVVLENAMGSVRPLIDERKHAMEVHIERGDLWVDVDPIRLEQVAVNLLNNAAKYSEDGGRIRLSAFVEGAEVVIKVEDWGIGIPPEKLPRMFDLFAQGDRTLARSEGGLGIGLTVVRKLVELHGGTVTARSDGHGRGSEFTVRLPAAAKPAASRLNEPREKAIRRARILVVDDNVDTARGLSKLLSLLGHDIATVHSGPEAIEAAREHRPEYILLDIGLPGMDGYEVASRLRREEFGKAAKIIAVTGYGRDEDRRRSSEAGFDHHVIKPVDADALVALMFDYRDV